MNRICCLFWLSLASLAYSETRYVVKDNPNAVTPYTNWATAASTIQDAVDAAAASDTILVTNGVYDTGGQTANGALKNRVAIAKPLVVRSVNGPEVTFIQGVGPNGDAAIRCAYLGTNAALIGFTLTNGHTRAYYGSDGFGGGIFCEPSAILSNCILIGNSACYNGGGAYRGALYNCTLTGNSAAQELGGGVFGGALYNCTLTGNSAGSNGGGANDGALYNCILTGNWARYNGGGANDGALYNCTLTGNSARYGGGAYNGALNNCIAYYNTAPQDPNYFGGTLNYCCTLPIPSSGAGNFTNAPGLAGLSNSHLTQGSPCIDAGNNDYVFTATDLDGEARTNGMTVDVGCDEFWADSCTGTLHVAILTPAGKNAVIGYPLSFQADIGGRPLTYVWRFGDGASTSNETVVSHAYESPGEYSVVLEAANLSDGMSATVTVRILSMAEATWYVAVDGNDAADGMSWATAKATIQAGIDAVEIPNGLVLVSNGVYATGGAFAAGLTNRVVITNAVTVQSVNGPEVTIIQGQGPMGIDAVRCAYVADGAKLVGFTLTNGFTDKRLGEFVVVIGQGGGIYCDSAGGVASNCILTGNSASYGGGACNGALYNCILTWNSAYYGGGSFDCTLYNCTLAWNSVTWHGGGSYLGTFYNCILYYNTSPEGSNYSGGCTFNYSCTTPNPGGTGNIANEPMFVDFGAGNLRLLSNSSCINAGTNQDWMLGAKDLDGNPRIYGGGRVDMGAYEYQGSLSVIPANWLARYGLPIDGSEDHRDADGDDMDNWQEWRCNTDPTNEISFLRFTTSASEGTGFVARWQSAEGVRYRLKRSTNLNTDAFGYLVRTNIVATPSINTETDTTAVGSGPWFYQVGVE